MTNFNFFQRFHVLNVALTSVAMAALLTLPCMVVQAQTLRPSTGPLRLSIPPASNALPSAQRSADFIVAVVNSEPITNNDVRNGLLRAEQQLTQSGGAMPSRPELTQLVLERLVTDKAQLQEARQSGLRIDDSSIDNAVQSVAQQNQLSLDDLKKRLSNDGVTFAKFRSNIRDEILVGRFRQREVDARVKISDVDIDQFLREQEGVDDLALIDLNLAQILVAVPENATPAQVAALQAKAQQAAERARAGTDFVQLVNEFSEPAARAAGGQLGLRSAATWAGVAFSGTATKICARLRSINARSSTPSCSRKN